MKDVAARAGVATSTVSRVFSAPHRISPEVRERVEHVVRELGYTINAAAQTLRRNDTGVVMVLVPDIGNPFFSKLLKGVEHRAREFSYSVLIGDTRGDRNQADAYVRQLDARRADALILLNGRVPGLRPLDQGIAPHSPDSRVYPVVVVSERIPGTSFPTVGIDNVAAAHRATTHLVDLGHRLIGHIAGPKDNILTGERIRGWRTALRAHGLAPSHSLVAYGDFSIASGRSAARHFLRSDPRPTAIFAANDEMAMGAVAELKQHGLLVPADISIVGFDDIEFAEVYDPAITTVRQPRFDMGRVAMSLVIQQLRGEPFAPGETVLPAEFVVRASTAPAG